jgi:hypothetical protein
VPVIDLPTLRSWIHQAGHPTTLEDDRTLRIHPAEGSPETLTLPPFFAQLGEDWLLLSMRPLLAPGAPRPEGLSRRLLAQNREMRLAKLALDQDGTVVLCAELPTESLDASEVRDAVSRISAYGERFLSDVLGRCS